ncbi:Protein FAR1-RELATED SEQUENCE 5 [Bienertia sinuspersici]
MDNSRANIGATKSYRLMKEHVGGYHNMAASVSDFKNFQRDIRKHIRGKDAQMLIENFKRKQEMCSSFFFKYEVDDKQHLIRVFWADAIGKKNYASFGDVVSFDTTFSMNEYCMVFAPFTGVDNSKSCVTFAATLLYREDTESFVWLFEAFRAAMSDCDPTCIITDQDPAMKIAIERVFDSSRTRHSLCMWHIMKKIPEKVGPTLAQNEDFMSEFCNCVWSKHTEPEEFDEIVTLIDHKRNSKMHTVRYHLENNSAECTCKMYEREGIPCTHILWVMKEKGLKSLPAAYIKTRWTKAAMNMPMFDLGGNLIEDTTNMEAVKKKVGHLWFEIFTCVSMAGNNEDCLDDFMKLIDGFKQSLLSRGNLQASGDKGKQMETLLDFPVPEEVTILGPNKSKNKGTQKRIKGKREQATEQHQKPLRLYRTCQQMATHDSRNCPDKVGY